MSIIRKLKDFIFVKLLNRKKVYKSKGGKLCIKYTPNANGDNFYLSYHYYETAIGIQCYCILNKIADNIFTVDEFNIIMSQIPRTKEKVSYLPKAWSYIEPCLLALYQYAIDKGIIKDITFNEFLQTYNE